MAGGWGWDWGVGLGLIGLTLMLHALGLAVVGLVMARGVRGLMAAPLTPGRAVIRSALLTGVAGWLLAILHGLDAALWAWAYRLLGAVGNFHTAMLYSVDCMATLGASGVILKDGWSLLGPLEGANGMLLFGVTTAFLFNVLSRVWRRLIATEA